MNKTIRRLKQEIERRGGQVHIDKNLPDNIAEQFLREILSCPDCVAPAREAKQTRRESPGH
jgi:hypothetical protein